MPLCRFKGYTDDVMLLLFVQDMIENVLEIKDTYVREVMTPLVDVVAIDAGASVMDFRNLWVTHQYSRYWFLLDN